MCAAHVTSSVVASGSSKTPREPDAPVDPVSSPVAIAAPMGAPDDVMAIFHPAVASWFTQRFAEPTPPQAAAWPSIQQGRSTLVAAPTGSGKTLTAFLAALDTLIKQGVTAHGVLPDETIVVYVSPLKALSNDIQLNLMAPLSGMTDALRRMGVSDNDIPQIRTAVRTGDTPQRERTAMSKRPPHIVVTTPESLYVLLGSDSGRRMLRTVRTVIVDEIHAVAGSKRGSHLSLSLARLEALCGRPLTRIGLSATQKPIALVAAFLVGMRADRPDDARREPAAPIRAQGLAYLHDQAHANGQSEAVREKQDRSRDCAIVDVGHGRPRDLALEVPPVPLEAVMSNEVWERVYDRLAELIVNTRRMAERVARHLGDRLGTEHVAAHHGSLAKEYRLSAEQRLKAGALKVLVATASLELGIDIGDVDLVCQMGSPRSIAAFLQRVGRSGHHVGGTPKGRLFPTSRDDLIECTALLDCVRRGELDALTIPPAPLDVLAQQIVAEVSCQEWDETALFDMIRCAYAYADLSRESFDAVVRMLATGYTGRQGPRAAYVHRDMVTGTLRARRGAKLTAVSAGGTIPENADFTVILEPQAISIGTVNEDFAVESLSGDIFQLGNASYRILKIETGKVRVEDARGQPPNIPFWLGEAPGRTDALSSGVARLRAEIDALLGSAQDSDANANANANANAENWLRDTIGLSDAAAGQIINYLARARAALGVLPSQDTLVMERFFDESGGTQLVIHTPFGSRVNRAWGLALRKRFCRTFNFELQAAATEDAIVLSLSTSHSFPLDEVWRYLHSQSAEHVLIQALLDAPLFGVRWRWNATTALALPRFTGGRKVAPQLQRMKSDDLLATVFPDQVACLENIVGERELPSHPLVDQTVDDCLHEAMDANGWLAVLSRMESGEIRLVSCDLPSPSPLAAEILNARPYAFLDDAPLEERRTQAVLSRRWTEATSADEMGALDADAIARVREEAWPRVGSADEMHEALLGLACISESEVRHQADGASWSRWLAELAHSGHVTKMQVAGDSKQGVALWVPLERLAALSVIYPQAVCRPPIAPTQHTLRTPCTPHLSSIASFTGTQEEAVVDLIRARMTGVGPLTVSHIARPLALPVSSVAIALTTLETEGYLIRGHFSAGIAMATPLSVEIEWCERRLLARIHRYTVKRLRREIEPVAPRDFQRFLFDWQHLGPSSQVQGREALSEVLLQLEGFQAAAAGWEEAILPARVSDYEPAWLDDLCRSGRIAWMRLSQRGRAADVASPKPRSVPTPSLSPSQPPLVSSPSPAPVLSSTSVYRAAPSYVAADDVAPSASALAEAKLAGLVGSVVPAAPIRTTPVVLLSRRHLADWSGLIPASSAGGRSSRAQAVHDVLRLQGAMFFDEIAASVRLLPMELESALGELVAAGEASADSFAGLRALISPTVRRNPWGGAGAGPRGRRHHARFIGGMEDAGRWSLLRRDPVRLAEVDFGAPVTPNNDAIEHVAMTLLRRYGVVFWRLLAREADWLPSWRDLLRVYHRLEARGDIRGGRFVDGVGGEQFALPEAIPVLRNTRKRAHDQQWQTLSAIDPLNLVGTVLAGDKVAAVVGNRIAFLDGVPVASLVAGRFHYAVDLPNVQREIARHQLSGR
jgi:ATP-dependent Lhr-like helicase